MTITELIEEAERLDKEATKAPWFCATGLSDGTVRAGTLKAYMSIGHFTNVQNAHFCATARTLLPLLLSGLKKQQRQIEELKKFASIFTSDAPALYADLQSGLTALAAELEDLQP